MRAPNGVQPGSQAPTRDCLDPWTTVFVQAGGDVAACCWAPPIGNLGRRSLEQIVEGEPVHELRRRLLTGDLDAACRACPARAYIGVGELERKVRALADDARRAPEFEVRRSVRAAERRRAELCRELGACEAELGRLHRLAEELEQWGDLARRRALDAPIVGEGRRAQDLKRSIRAQERELRALTYPLRKPLRSVVRRWIVRALSGLLVVVRRGD